LISDGLHFVREASPKDQHPMRFVIDQHKQVEHLPRFSTLPRHCESLEVGIDMMRRYTKRACQQSPELSRAFKSANGPVTLPEPITTDPDKPQRKPRPRPEPKAKKVEFPITRFTCMHGEPGRSGLGLHQGQVGRNRASVDAARVDAHPGDKLPHELGEYAVLR
jgi:hypothetical protein